MNSFKDRILNVDARLLGMLPARLATYYNVFPFEEAEGSLLLLAPADLKMSVKEDLQIMTGRKIVFVLVERALIQEAIAKHYGIGADVAEVLVSERSGQKGELSNRFVLNNAFGESDASVIKLVNDLLTDAIQCRASDIHIEPFEEVFRIRYRIDGLLQEARIAKNIASLAPALISRIKIMADLDIGEKRLPQDGRIKVSRFEEEIDLRISVIATAYGEAIVLRILKPLVLFELAEVGFDAAAVEALRKMLRLPNGLILFTGPTGSGKTTSLYACLKELNQIERKIITIEDPVEYKLTGALQIQVNSKIGLTFAKALRSVLRHDPDCIMIGEIRDQETAEMAARAALTGHLVLSTLHTNDAVSAMPRLIEMGIEPYLTAASIQGVVAQRLVRKRCDPCEKCLGTGFYGRTIAYEILKVDSSITQMITQGRDSSALREYAEKKGMASLSRQGEFMVSQGITTLEEIRRVCGVGIL